MKEKFDIWELILTIIIVAVATIIIYWGIQLIFGGSPTLSQFNSILIVMVIGILFKFVHSNSKINREIGEIKVGMKHSFNKIKDDMEFIKGKVSK